MVQTHAQQTFVQYNWSDKWPNTLTSIRKLANVVGNWPVADCYFELCYSGHLIPIIHPKACAADL